jgi:sulfofructose kinase
MRTVRKEKAKKQAAPRRNAGPGGFPALPGGAKAVDVVGLGENSVDLVAVAPRFPRPDTKQRLSGLAPLVGGQAATAMVACARLGWRARYLGGVGDDEDGRRVTASLEEAGVDVQVLVRPGVSTRRALVLVDERTGRRAILEHRDAAVALRVEELDPALVTSGRLLLLDARDLALSCAAARLARAAGIPVVLDVEEPAAGLEELLRLVDVIVAAGAFPTRMTGARTPGAALRRLAALSGAPVVIATLGPEGSLAWLDGREARTPGFRVLVVDTTGAGDAFRGGLIAAWLGAGRVVRPLALLAYANAVAALNCRALGAQTALPTRAEIDAFVTRLPYGQSK